MINKYSNVSGHSRAFIKVPDKLNFQSGFIINYLTDSRNLQRISFINIERQNNFTAINYYFVWTSDFFSACFKTMKSFQMFSSVRSDIRNIRGQACGIASE